MPRRKGVQDDEQVDEVELGVDSDVEPDETWLDRRQAAVALGISQMTVRRLESQGLLRGVPMPGTRGKKVVYDPEQIQSLSGSVQAESATVDEMNAQTLVAAAVGLSKQSAAHSERLLQLIEEPSHALLRTLLEENTLLRTRIRDLEQERTEQFKLMETMRSEQHARELETLKWAAKNERQDALLKVVIDQAPKLTQQIIASTQGPELLTSLSSLANSLTTDQITKLTGLLDESQAMQLGKLLEVAKSNEKKSTEITSTNITEPHALLKE